MWPGSPLPLPHSPRGLLNASSRWGECASLLNETLATYTRSCYFFSSSFVIVFGIDFSFFLLFLRVPLGSPNLMPSFLSDPYSSRCDEHLQRGSVASNLGDAACQRGCVSSGGSKIRAPPCLLVPANFVRILSIFVLIRLLFPSDTCLSI